MENKRKLHINASMVDMTRAREESFAAYEEISINAAVVLTTEPVRTLVSRYHVKISAAAILDVPAGAKLRVINGSGELTKGEIAAEPTVLMVNGSLLVHPDADEALDSYAMMLFNGSVLCPDNLRGAMGRATVNGSLNYYPAEAKLVRGDLELNRRFIRKASEDELYYVTGTVTMLREDLDADALIGKDVTLMAKRALLRARYEPVSDLFDGNPEIVLVPDDYAFIGSGAVMEEALILKHGKKLFIDGNLSIPDEALPLAEQLEDVIITGTLIMKESVKAAWLKVVSQFAGLRLYKGQLLEGLTELTVTNAMLDAADEGLTIIDCVNLTIDAEVSPERLKEKIHGFEDCVNITCAAEQAGIVRLLAKDCVNVTVDEDDDIPEEEDGDWVKINAASYML